MEVVSPLAFVPTVAGAGSKRGFIASYSPSHFQMETAGGCGAVTTTAAAAAAPLSEEDALLQQRSAKRRRFHHADTSVDSLSNAFGSPSAFFQSKMGGPNHHGALLKRHWAGSSTSPSPPPEGGAAAAAAATGDIQRVMDEQAATIESLKKDKTTLETNLGKLQTDHERVVKENQVLRKAFQIQQERQSHAEQELETAKQYKAGAEEQIKKLDQIILSLRYHLQAQQHVSNDDFMGLSHRPPDVY